MRSTLPRCAVLLLALLLRPPTLAAEQPEWLADVRKDMTAAEVQKLLAPRKPDRVARQILFRRHLEQWIFDDSGVRIEFDCLPGEEPRVLQVIAGPAR
jgi:hypothetical protein